MSFQIMFEVTEMNRRTFLTLNCEMAYAPNDSISFTQHGGRVSVRKCKLASSLHRQRLCRHFYFKLTIIQRPAEPLRYVKSKTNTTISNHLPVIACEMS